MDENPYRSPRTYGYRRVSERDELRPDPAPILPKTPWLKDRDAILLVAAIGFFIAAGAILIGLLFTVPPF